MKNFLELRNVSIGYGNTLLENVSAELRPGELCLVIGDNGTGKTTLFRTILHQIPALSGKIFIDGKNISAIDVRELPQKIAAVFSKTSVPENFTTEDLISFGKYIHYPYYFSLKTADRQHVNEIIKSLNLEKFRDYKLSQLSDGNLQKAFIGRALAQNSPMIILDEPTTHLDEKNKVMILELLQQLAKNSGKAILFSSHDWRIAGAFASNIWYIKNNTLQSGIAEEILLRNRELISSPISLHPEITKNLKITASVEEANVIRLYLQKNAIKALSGEITVSDALTATKKRETIHTDRLSDLLSFLEK